MYLVSLYFDEKANNRIQQYINLVAENSGNPYMIDGEVPPHITISAFETDEEHKVIELLDDVCTKMKRGMIQWVSIGVFLPYVIFLSPVLNHYLHQLSVHIYDSIVGIKDISVSKYYQPLQWMPHTTIGKKLSKEEMRVSFQTLQDNFSMFQGVVTQIGLSKTQPYEEIKLWELS